MDALFTASGLLIIGLVLLALIMFLYFIPVRLWLTAYFSGVHLKLVRDLVGMRLRNVAPSVIVRPLITAHKAGIYLETPQLEAHYLAGGNVQKVVNALISADVNQLRVPGWEIEEVQQPVGMAVVSFDVIENVGFEGFYQYEWEETIIDVPGSFWSTNDFAGIGGTQANIGFGRAAENQAASVATNPATWCAGPPDLAGPGTGSPCIPCGPMVRNHVRHPRPARCWIRHQWGEWTTYDAVRPVRAIGPSLRHMSAVMETRRRRQCQRCGAWDERVVHAEPVSHVSP